MSVHIPRTTGIGELMALISFFINRAVPVPFSSGLPFISNEHFLNCYVLKEIFSFNINVLVWITNYFYFIENRPIKHICNKFRFNLGYAPLSNYVPLAA